MTWEAVALTILLSVALVLAIERDPRPIEALACALVGCEQEASEA